jgi:hypothetical protein
LLSEQQSVRLMQLSAGQWRLCWLRDASLSSHFISFTEDYLFLIFKV